MKVSELSGEALDWAVIHVSRCSAYDPETDKPSTDWAQGGPIIERERIELRGDGDGGWIAYDNLNPEQYGPTPLIAAMRCYVASKLGEEIEIPEELTEKA